MSTRAIHMTRDELVERRAVLLGELGMTYDELHELARGWYLNSNEREVYEAIRSIDWLLGGPCEDPR